MSNSSLRKSPKDKMFSRKEALEKMEKMAALTNAMEVTLMEWEVWFRLLEKQKKYLSQEQYEAFISDGPIFTDIPGKIMQSVRDSMPQIDDVLDEQEQRAAILDGNGNAVSSEPTQKPVLMDGAGRPIV